jgi:hypothetical protein
VYLRRYIGFVEFSSIQTVAARYLGIDWTLGKTNRLKCIDFSIHLRSEVPVVGYAVLIELAFRKFPLCRSISLLPGGGLSISRIVSDQSEFMVACRRGDIHTVIEYLKSGKNRPDDVSETNMTPLLVSHNFLPST